MVQLMFLADDLRVETVAFGLVRLQGSASKHYVCLNKDGKVIARVSVINCSI